MNDQYQLVALPNPINALTRNAFMMNGMTPENAELAQSIRTEILKGKQANTEIPTSAETAKE